MDKIDHAAASAAGHFNVVGTDTTPTPATPDIDDLAPDPLGYLMDEAQAISDDIEEIEIGEQKVPTAYLAGPMSGKPDFNFPAFHDAALKLRQAGLNVLNPADNFDGDTSHPRETYMALDIFHVLNSNMVVLLPGWQASRGATLEAYLAHELGLPLFYFKPEGLEPCTVDPRAALRSYLTKVTKGAKRRLNGAPQVKMAARPVATRDGKPLHVVAPVEGPAEAPYVSEGEMPLAAV